MDIIRKTEEIISRYPLCNTCLGRLFSSLGYGLENSQRGFALKTMLLMKAYNSLEEENNINLVKKLARSGFKPAMKLLEEKFNTSMDENEVEKCFICKGLLEEESLFKKISQRILTSLREIESKTFLIGVRVDESMVAREMQVISDFGVETSETLKREINRKIGKIIEASSRLKVDYKDPEVTVIVDFPTGNLEVNIKPLFVYGRYRKLVRGLPQSAGKDHVRWDAPPKPSIEEYIGRPLLKVTRGEEVRLHGAGREDVDVLTLGSGRPFVAEVLRPRIRCIDLNELARRIREYSEGKVEVEDLRIVARSMVEKIKVLSEKAVKLYRAIVTFEGDVDEKDLKSIESSFKNILIKQQTPLRVLKRRADKVRSKIVYYVKTKKISSNTVEFLIKCQGGLYVKELITGDAGRTRPSFSEILGTQPRKIVLDILYIEETTRGLER
ncbi:MAG: tRNA pseudouridine(54/55) synthase Pus10 [Thermoprotei archaeon]|nr:MAG: tRNA pseudouridine(54/55) synthase Pus10 [Thermoprotei archaeon]